MSQQDIRYHVSGLRGIKEEKLQRALDMRLSGALIHVYEASPRSSWRHKKRLRIGKLAIPPEMVDKREAFRDALNEPGKKCKLSIGPYDIVITLYREFETREMKLTKENDNLRKRLGELERSLEELLQQKKDSDTLLEHVLDSKTPIAVKAIGSSRNPRGSRKPRPSIKRHPKRSPVHKRMKIPVETRVVNNSGMLCSSIKEFNQQLNGKQIIAERAVEGEMNKLIQELVSRTQGVG